MRSVDAHPEVFRAVARYNYRQQFGSFSRGLVNELENMLLEGDYVLGKAVSDFEGDFASYCDCNHARGVNTGTDALVIALRALGIGRGDKVIAPANTFHATVAAIELAGAVPVLVDVEADSYLWDQEQVNALLDGQVRAIIPVHLFGKPAPLLSLLATAERKGVQVIEDAAQAHGASINGRRVGSFGVAGCFSFHPSKNLAAAGDAGAIVTNDAEFANAIEMQRSLGQHQQNQHLVVGLNSKLDAIQARILSWKLPQLDTWNASRAKLAERYRSELRDLPLSFQSHSDDEVHVYHLFQIRTQHRDDLLSCLKSRGVDAVIRYPTPIHLQPAFRKWGWRKGDYPVAERLCDQSLCLPIRPDMSEEEVDFVTSAITGFFDDLSGKRVGR